MIEHGCVNTDHPFFDHETRQTSDLCVVCGGRAHDVIVEAPCTESLKVPPNERCLRVKIIKGVSHA